MRPHRTRTRALAAAAALAAALALPAPLASASTHATSTGLRTPSVPLVSPSRWRAPSRVINRVVLVGDSLAQEASPFVQFLTAPKRFVPKYWGGTAPCDWVKVDLEATRSTVVVITFTGNSLTPCMEDGQGGHLAHAALIERYRIDLATLLDRARRAGARVVLVGQPAHAEFKAQDDIVDGIDAIYREFAGMFDNVSFVDAGAAVEAADGSYTDRLPCGSFDPQCGDDGQVAVRGDGIHFCPEPGIQPCPVWSSGALRYALAISAAANAPWWYD